MSDDVPFARRRNDLIDRAVAVFSNDPRFPAGWLEGSLADGSADAYSDIDLHLCVVEGAWDEVWNGRLGVIERVGPILASADIRGIFAVGCLMSGPVKLDVFFEKESTVAGMPRMALTRLWGNAQVFERLKIGDNLGDAMIKVTLESTVFGILQGSAWPVRILARGQIETFLFNELYMVEMVLVPLMLLEKDRRALHRNMFTRAKLLSPEQRAECARLVERIGTAVRNNDRAAMRDTHIDIARHFYALAAAAFARYGLEFPPRVEQEMIDFYRSEWPI